LSIDPNSVAAKLGLARLLVAKNDFDGARKLVDGTIKDDPNNAELAELDGIIASNQKRTSDALSALNRAVALRDSSEYRIRLATAQTDAGRFDDAQASLQTWLRAHPNDIPVRLALGNVFMAMKRYDDAQAQFTELLALAPNNFVVENNLAEALTSLGKVQDALAHARHAAALAPWAPEVLDTLGTVLLNNRSTSEALAMFQSATRLAPTDPMLQFHLAQALVSAGERDRAKRLLRPILQQPQPFEERDAAQKLLTELGG
jgi:predicted Zn-dependent protease